MASKRKRKAKSKKQRKPRQPKEKSKLEQLKEKQSQLFLRVSENRQIILQQTGIDEVEFRDVVSKYGYEGLSTLEGFGISAPIYDQMVEQFKTYDEIAQTVERLKVLEGKMLIHDSKQLVQEMEEKIQDLDKNEAYYTELPDKEGIIKMKKKWFAEHEFWLNRKLKLEKFLTQDPNSQQLKTQFEDAQLHLRELLRKRNWAKIKNINPSLVKYAQKFGKTVSSIQGSIREVTKPFAEAGGDSFGSTKGDAKVGNGFENFFDEPKSKKKTTGTTGKTTGTDWSNFYD